MWLRSEKRSSRIAQSTVKSSINLRKIIKNTPALKNLKQTTTPVTSSRRSAVYSPTNIAKTNKNFRKTGDARQSSSIKCNIKSPTNVKRLGKRSSASLGKRYERKKFEPAAEKQKCNRLRRKSLRSMSEMGKENCWQDQDQLDLYTIDGKRGRKQRVEAGCGPIDTIENADSDGNKDNLTNSDTLSNFALVNEVCDSCKPSTTCNCSSSSSQTEGSQLTDELTAPKTGCVNYIECDSTTDNDRTNLPSTSMATTVRILFFIFFF